MSELVKEIQNGRILKNNGSWMYCDKCNKTVAYLCYTTYQSFEFDFVCNCGNKGSFKLSYKSKENPTKSNKDLKLIKNRLCCAEDDSPLFTVVNKNIKHMKYQVTCKGCLTEYSN